jgi:hypothetical protein
MLDVLGGYPAADRTGGAAGGAGNTAEGRAGDWEVGGGGLCEQLWGVGALKSNVLDRGCRDDTNHWPQTFTTHAATTS